METISLSTRLREEMKDVTDEVREVVRRNRWQDGALVVFCPHTTCGVTHQRGL